MHCLKLPPRDYAELAWTRFNFALSWLWHFQMNNRRADSDWLRGEAGELGQENSQQQRESSRLEGPVCRDTNYCKMCNKTDLANVKKVGEINKALNTSKFPHLAVTMVMDHCTATAPTPLATYQFESSWETTLMGRWRWLLNYAALHFTSSDQTQGSLQADEGDVDEWNNNLFTATYGHFVPRSAQRTVAQPSHVWPSVSPSGRKFSLLHMDSIFSWTSDAQGCSNATQVGLHVLPSRQKLCAQVCVF